MTTPIKLCVFDFDGVFTNGSVSFGVNGAVVKSYNVKDGMGIKLLKSQGIRCRVLSGFPVNNATSEICHHLGMDQVVMGVSGSKLSVLQRWARELGITMDQIAYMGDDVNDLDCIRGVRISGCPSDAHSSCRENSLYVCHSSGGNGAVREFAEFVLNHVPHLRDMSALVCVKMHSSRCVGKNLRRFLNSSLLEMKLEALLRLRFLHRVVLNTESLEIIEFVRERYPDEERLVCVQRDPLFATDDVDNREFCRHVLQAFPSESVLYSPVTMPFISTQTYQSMYRTFCESSYDSVILAADGKQGGGHSHENHSLCFAASMMSVSDAVELGDFIGVNPYFQACEMRERMDIDYPFEFSHALFHGFNRDAVYGMENLKEVSLYDMDELARFSTDRRWDGSAKPSRSVEIIDVTPRDGGFVNGWSWTREEVVRMLRCASDTGIDYFELGYLMDAPHYKESDGEWRHMPFELIDEVVALVEPRCKISAMIDYWRYDVAHLLPRDQTRIDLIRITCYMEKVDEALSYCAQVKALGYDVSLNVMCGSYLTDEITSTLIDAVRDNVDLIEYFYVADTFGAMIPSDVRHVFGRLVKALQPLGIKVGFHIHNNSQIAMGNALAALEQGVDIVDASYGGKGRGSGNLYLEFLILFLHINGSRAGVTTHFSIEPFLRYLEEVGASEHTKHALIGFLNVHPYRLRDYSDDYGLFELYRALESMPLDKRIDYTL